MLGLVIEEKVILHAHHLYLIYSKLGTLYDIISDALRPSTDPIRPSLEPYDNGWFYIQFLCWLVGWED